MALYLSRCSHLLAATFLSFLSACGGQDSDSTASTTGPTLLPTVFSSEGRALNTCALDPACSRNPLAPFFSFPSMAPDDGTTLSGLVRLEVYGNEMANVELLPATGYLPRLGVFNRTGDKTKAYLDFDTTALPNGPMALRISAFNMPTGQGGAEIVAMPPRAWNISNPARSTAPFAAGLVAAPPHGAVITGITRLEVRGNGIGNAELLPANGSTPRLGMFNVSADKTMAWLDLDSRSIPDGAMDVRISVFNVTAGQPGAQEIVAMPARRWEFRNGVGFSATVTMAPAHGAIISGRMRLEVHGKAMANVELLPATGYSPRLGGFNISFDKTFAEMEIDTATLPNGRLDARISVFNVGVGQQGAKEIIAMPVRQWEVRNPAPGTGAPFSATLTFAPGDGQLLCTSAFLALRGTGLKNVELLPAAGYTPIYGRFNVADDGTSARLGFDVKKVTPGELRVRISAFDASAGNPAKEIVAMPERRWRITHLDCRDITEAALQQEQPNPSTPSMLVQN